MAETEQAAERDSSKCVTHNIDLMTGCVGCFKFFCPVCLNCNDLCSSSQGSHVFSTIVEVKKMIKSDLETSLKVVQKDCDILEEKGRAVLEEFDQQRKKMDAVLDGERTKIVSYLEEVRGVAKKATDDTDEVAKSDKTVLLRENFPKIVMPRIMLQHTGMKCVTVSTTNDILSYQQNRLKLYRLKSLKYVSRLALSTLGSSTQRGLISHIFKNVRYIHGGDTATTYAILRHRLRDDGSFQLDKYSKKVSEKPLKPPISCSDGSNASLIVCRTDNGERLAIFRYSSSDIQIISKGWCDDILGVAILNGCLVVVSPYCLRILTNLNAPEFTVQCEHAKGFDDEVKPFHVSKSHFCVLEKNHLHSYNWNEELSSVHEVWEADLRGRGYTAGCYVEEFEMILLMANIKGIFINPYNGEECGKTISVIGLGIDSVIHDVSTVNGYFVFGVTTGEEQVMYSSYKLEMEKDDEDLQAEEGQDSQAISVESE